MKELNSETVGNLQELTGKESGIVLYYAEGRRTEAVVCNWASVDGLPRVDPFGVGILGLGETFERVEPEDCDDVADLLDGVEIVFANGEDMPAAGRLYRLEEHSAVVLTFLDWA